LRSILRTTNITVPSARITQTIQPGGIHIADSPLLADRRSYYLGYRQE
jgi:hypothetical protein